MGHRLRVVPVASGPYAGRNYEVLSQQSGYQDLISPSFTPAVPPMHTAKGGVSTLDGMLTHMDICNLSDCGEATPRVLAVMGDTFRMNAFPYVGGVAQDVASRNQPISAGQTSFLATDAAGLHEILFTAGTLSTFKPYGIVGVDTGVGPAGITQFRYFGVVHIGGSAWKLTGVKFLNGGGTVNNTMDVFFGLLGGQLTLPNCLFTSTDTDLAAGFAYDDLVGSAIVPTAPYFGAPTWTALYPVVAAAKRYNLTGAMRVEGTKIIGHSATALPGTGRPVPYAYNVVLESLIAMFTTKATALNFSHANVPSTIDCNTLIDAVPASWSGHVSTDEQRAFAIETTTAVGSAKQCLVIKYVDATVVGGKTRFTGCTLWYGTGTTYTNAPIIQGIDGANSGIDAGATDYPIYDVAHDANPLTFRGTWYRGLNRAGGDVTATFPGWLYQAKVRMRYEAKLDSGSGSYAPSTITRIGEVSNGGCATPHPTGGGTDWDGNPTGMRQWHSFTQTHGSVGTVGAAFVSNRCHLVYSDDGGHSWVEGPSWDQNPEMSDPVVAFTPYRHIDGYVYAVAQPACVAMRWPEDELHIKASVRYWDGDSWEATFPTNLLAARLFPESPLNNVHIHYSAPHDCWIATMYYFDAIFFSTAPEVTGPWTGLTILNTNAYGGSIHPFSQKHGNPDNEIFYTFTNFEIYQTYEAKFTVIDPEYPVGSCPVLAGGNAYTTSAATAAQTDGVGPVPASIT